MTYEQMLAIPASHRMTGMLVQTDRGLYQLQKMINNIGWVALKPTEIKISPTYSSVQLQQALGRVFRNLSLGYIARIIDGKLVRVARVSADGVDYNYEQP